MLTAYFTRYIDRFERTWGYDASYMRALLKAAPRSFFKFGFVSGLVRGTRIAVSGEAGPFVK